MAAEALLAKRVQEMVLKGEDPHGPYICRDDDQDIEEDSSQNSPIPVIDMSCLLSSNKKSDDELKKLRSALSSWGCFQAIGHGISNAFLNEVLKAGREFFQQPIEEKNKYAKGVTEFQGYGADPVPDKGQSLDWSDRLFLDLVPEDQRDYRFWPENPASFRKVLEEYSENVEKLTRITSKAMAKSLNLAETCFLDQFGERAQLGARFNYYLPSKRPHLVLGLKPHADGSGYTLILQDDVGLQVLNYGKWFTVTKNPGALLILMGDQMEIMSNGIFKSPIHRVLSNAKRDRISLAVFYTPQLGKEIGPQEDLISEETPKLFKTVKDYADIHFEYYQRGMRALQIARV